MMISPTVATVVVDAVCAGGENFAVPQLVWTYHFLRLLLLDEVSEGIGRIVEREGEVSIIDGCDVKL